MPINVNDEGIQTYHAFDRCFECKASCYEETYPLLQNDIYGIISDNTGFLWKDEWAIEGEYYEELFAWSVIKTHIKVRYCGTVKTEAGIFEDCLCVSLNCKGYEYGLSYRAGKRDYYFAKGVGIIKTVVFYDNGRKQAIYELEEYSKNGTDSFFPLIEGSVRKYKAINTADGIIGATEYVCEKDKKGRMIMFANRTGISKNIK